MAMTWLQLFLDVPRARWEESLRFWSAATGWAVSPARGEDDQFVTLLPPHGTHWVKLQAIDTDARIHLDLDSRDRDGEIDRALAAGARPAWVYEDVTVMRSPGGLLFCHTLAGPERPTLHRGDDDLVLDQVCLDVPGRLWEAEVAFWATMTGRTPRACSRTEFVLLADAGDPAGAPRVLLQRLLSDAPAVGGHPDFAVRDRPRERARHLRLGATPIADHAHWSVLRAPSGHQYCLTDRRPSTGTLAPATD